MHIIYNDVKNGVGASMRLMFPILKKLIENTPFFAKNTYFCEINSLLKY